MMERYIRDLKFSRATLVADAMAGLTVAFVTIPSGMAYALVAGVNPVYGLYSGMVSTIVASLTVRSSLMVVTLTNALALVTADQLQLLGSDVDPVRAMFTLTLLTGAIMFVLGLLRLGSVIRFVCKEVMSGFVFATALLIALGQYKDLVGYTSLLDTNKLFKAIDITLRWREWQWNTVIVGVGVIGLLLLLQRTRLKKWADILAIGFASAIVALTGWSMVQVVGDIAQVPHGLAALPKPMLPDFKAVPLLLSGALAAAVVGLAESSGVGAAYPNRDGSRSSMSQDFSGQGLGNLVGAFFQAMPAGGSLSRTGIAAGTGARTRWSGVFAGLLMAVVLVIAGGLAGMIPMTSLAAMLIVIGVEVMIKHGHELVVAWKISKLHTSAAIVTILVGVFSDLTEAIFAGVILSLLLYAFTKASSFRVVQWVKTADGGWEERPVPRELPSNQATVISVDGNVYFASVYSFDDLFPAIDQTTNAALILHLRDRTIYSLTGVDWAEKSVKKMQARGIRPMVSGVDPETMAILERVGLVELFGRDSIFLATPRLGESTARALAAAEAWIAQRASSQAVESDKG
jgi:sulfate permease, SulP family